MNSPEERLNQIWEEAPKLEAGGEYNKALTLWWEAMEIKLRLGTTGAGDIAELAGLREKIGNLEARVRSLKE